MANVPPPPIASAPDLRVQLGRLELKNPVTVASGTYGYGTEYAAFHDPAALGAIFLKGLTLEPRPGNIPQRLVETPSGLMNAIGIRPMHGFKAWDVCMKFAENGLLAKPTHEHIIRFAPPLVINEEQVEECAGIIAASILSFPR